MTVPEGGLDGSLRHRQGCTPAGLWATTGTSASGLPGTPSERGWHRLSVESPDERWAMRGRCAACSASAPARRPRCPTSRPRWDTSCGSELRTPSEPSTLNAATAARPGPDSHRPLNRHTARLHRGELGEVAHHAPEPQRLVVQAARIAESGRPELSCIPPRVYSDPWSPP